jgi:hypothetical protein
MWKFLLSVLVCLGVTAAIYKVLQWSGNKPEHLMPMAFLYASPVWGRLMAPGIIAIVPAIRRRAREDATKDLNGRFYSYDNFPIRLYLIDEVIWIPAVDLKPLLLPAPDARELRLLGPAYAPIDGKKLPGFSEEGLLRLLATRCSARNADQRTVRFRNWLRSEAYPNLRRLPSSTAL